MLKNFIGIIGRQWAQRRLFGRPARAGHVASQRLAHVSPAFEAWLQAYRERLEQVCERASARAVSA
jgi:hypothetical protein